MNGTVMLVAFHFPPAAMGSGHLRTLGFARYLPDFGWRPIVLSARPMAYARTLPVQEGTIPQGCLVRRALAPDISRHLAIRGHYPGFLAQPDRWTLWRIAAIAAGVRLIRRHRVTALWSTYPIMSAHCIAYALHRRTGLPWIADFRDPVSTSVEPGNPYSFASQYRWERRVVAAASHTVLTTPGARDAYAERYPEAGNQSRFTVIQNGFDDATFTDLPVPPPRGNRPVLLVHSGMLYAQGRNPLAFFRALAELKSTRVLSAQTVHIRLRASGSEVMYRSELTRLGIDDLVELAPPVSNHAALEEQARADGLLLFQGAEFDRQIPAKLYEYLRIGRPIFAVVSRSGDTAKLLQQTGGAELASIDDSEQITARLRVFVQAVREGAFRVASDAVVRGYSRCNGAANLAALLDPLVPGP